MKHVLFIVIGIALAWSAHPDAALGKGRKVRSNDDSSRTFHITGGRNLLSEEQIRIKGRKAREEHARFGEALQEPTLEQTIKAWVEISSDGADVPHSDELKHFLAHDKRIEEVLKAFRESYQRKRAALSLGAGAKMGLNLRDAERTAIQRYQNLIQP